MRFKSQRLFLISIIIISIIVAIIIFVVVIEISIATLSFLRSLLLILRLRP